MYNYIYICLRLVAFNCVPESTKTIKNHFMSVLLDFVAKCLPMFLVMPLRSPTFLKESLRCKMVPPTQIWLVHPVHHEHICIYHR